MPEGDENQELNPSDDTEGGGTESGTTEGGTTSNDSDDDDNTNEGDTQMTTTEIAVSYPVMDGKQSYEITTVAAASEVAISTDMVIIDAMKCKNNSLTIFLNVTTAGTITIKAGNIYPNAVLGDAPITISNAGFVAIQLEDISRFECKYEGTASTVSGIKLVGDGTIAGKIFVVGKRVGVDTVANQNTRDYNNGRTLHYDPTYTG